MKVVRKDLFRQDPKAEQNLMREIDVLKKLRQCEYVVHLYHVQVCVLVVGVVNGCHGNRICNELMRL